MRFVYFLGSFVYLFEGFVYFQGGFVYFLKCIVYLDIYWKETGQEARYLIKLPYQTFKEL